MTIINDLYNKSTRINYLEQFSKFHMEEGEVVYDISDDAFLEGLKLIQDCVLQDAIPGNNIVVMSLEIVRSGHKSGEERDSILNAFKFILSQTIDPVAYNEMQEKAKEFHLKNQAPKEDQ